MGLTLPQSGMNAHGQIPLRTFPISMRVCIEGIDLCLRPLPTCISDVGRDRNGPHASQGADNMQFVLQLMSLSCSSRTSIERRPSPIGIHRTPLTWHATGYE